MPEETNLELERFRRQWQEEVTARSKGSSAGQSRHLDIAPYTLRRHEEPQEHQSPLLPRTNTLSSRTMHDDLEDTLSGGYHDLENKDDMRKLGESGSGVHPSTDPKKEPTTALEHYEKAVERETHGSLGDSVNLYRKAYKLDEAVDQVYKKKHFPPSVSKSIPTDPNPSGASVTVPNTAHHSLGGPPASTISDLIDSFSETRIPPALAPIEGIPPPLCPIAALPSEVLNEVILQTAALDVAAFVRLASVCKHLAYLVATEDRIWRRICLSPDVGFPGMHYIWACEISGHLLDIAGSQSDHSEGSSTGSGENLLSELSNLSLDPSPRLPTPESLLPSSLYPSYMHMFHYHPRIRFGGCYISTVNYVRPGVVSSPTNWNVPIHIVTYYRYLRFFRDGSCVSLLTTSEPADVVHYLRKEHMHGHHSGGLPSAVMSHALRGRWRLSGHPSNEKYAVAGRTHLARNDEPEGDVHIETVGVDADKYTYVMQLSLKSAGRKNGTRNNKLVWKGFWSYNKLTDDWGEFGLRNDRAFFWSRVGSYGLGE